MKPCRFLIVLMVLLHHPFGSMAQISHADSVYLNNICKETTYISYWNYPGKWFHHDEVSSVQNFYERVDNSYLFYNDEFADCYRKINVSAVLEKDTAINFTLDTFEIAHNMMFYGNKDPFVKVKFELNNKSAYSYALIDSSSKAVYDHDHAFVIISGTGTNQIKSIVDGSGYHDYNCYVRNLLKPHGDVYVMSMPNEDYRAIYFNKKKASSLPSYSPPYLINYLNAANKSLGLNRLIETVAFIKHLKAKYKKVFVLGLSTGGKVALWASLLSEPDASLIASGYSILVDNDYNSQIINAMSYGNYLLVYDKDSTRSRLAQLHTQFLFTQAQNDGPVVQLDLDSNITKNFLSQVPNLSFYSNYVNHSFPPCPVIDSFIGRCIRKAKVFLSWDPVPCNYDSTVMKLHFFGKPPFTFDVYKGNAFVSAHTASDTTISISLFDEGDYLIRNIIDSAGVAGYTSDTFKYRKTQLPVAQVSRELFVCDSNKTGMQFNMNGTGPFMLYYTKNNMADSLVFNQNQNDMLFAGGHYVFNGIKDATQCINAVTDSFTLPSSVPDLQLNGLQYDCATNKSTVSLLGSGLLPLTLHYYDSLQQSLRVKTMNQFSESLYLDSGAFTFLTLTDSLGCTKQVDTGIYLHTQPVSFGFDSLKYNCNDDFAILPVNFHGKAGWTIELQHNGVNAYLMKNTAQDTLHLKPGLSRIVKVTDGNNCVTYTKDSLIMNPFRKISANVFTGQFDCEKQYTPVQIHTSGNYPMHLSGSRNGIVFNEIIYGSPQSYFISEGNFSIDSLRDHHSCMLQDIYHTTIVNDTMPAQGLYRKGLLLTTNDSMYDHYFWFLNGELFRETQVPYIDIVRNGSYELGYFNNNQCFLKSMKLDVDMGKISVYPNPVNRLLNILVSLDPSEKIQYTLQDITGDQILKGSLQEGLNQIQLPDLARGIYLLHFITDQKNISYPTQKIYKY